MSSTAAARSREQVLAILAEAGESPVPGGSLAERLGCSRDAVYRLVRDLREEGVEVVAGQDGYRLAAGQDPVVPLLVHPRLESPVRGPVRWHRELASTLDLASELAREGAPEGTVVGADHLAGGAWADRPGDGLLCSVVLRPPVHAHAAALLPIMALVAVAEAVEAKGVEGVALAWPNDVLVAGRKIAGVHCRVATDQDQIAWAAVGIGLNVRSAPDLAGTHWPSTSLAGCGLHPHRGDVLVAVLVALARRYRAWISGRSGPGLGSYARRDHLVGRAVRIGTPGGEVAGEALGLDDLGHLRVRTPAGEKVVASGEVLAVR